MVESGTDAWLRLWGLLESDLGLAPARAVECVYRRIVDSVVYLRRGWS